MAKTPSCSNWILYKSVHESLWICCHVASHKLSSGLALPGRALRLGSVCACSRPTLHFGETASACCFLLFFSAGTYVLLQKAERCYSKEAAADSCEYWKEYPHVFKGICRVLLSKDHLSSIPRTHRNKWVWRCLSLVLPASQPNHISELHASKTLSLNIK